VPLPSPPPAGDRRSPHSLSPNQRSVPSPVPLPPPQGRSAPNGTPARAWTPGDLAGPPESSAMRAPRFSPYRQGDLAGPPESSAMRAPRFSPYRQGDLAGPPESSAIRAPRFSPYRRTRLGTPIPGSRSPSVEYNGMLSDVPSSSSARARTMSYSPESSHRARASTLVYDLSGGGGGGGAGNVEMGRHREISIEERPILPVASAYSPPRSPRARAYTQIYEDEEEDEEEMGFYEETPSSDHGASHGTRARTLRNRGMTPGYDPTPTLRPPSYSPIADGDSRGNTPALRPASSSPRALPPADTRRSPVLGSNFQFNINRKGCPECRKEYASPRKLFCSMECHYCNSDKTEHVAGECGHVMCLECYGKMGGRPLPPRSR
jgi:hypothetical protein